MIYTRAAIILCYITVINAKKSYIWFVTFCRTSLTAMSLTNSSLSGNLRDGSSEIVTDVKYTQLDKSLVNRESFDPLQKTYSALACNPYNMNIYAEIYELAMKCSSSVK